MGVEYDGSCFHGWQRQPSLPSVQAVLEGALSQVADAPIRLTTAGRTDSGVHATGQVASFATLADRPLKAWVRGTNSLTPKGLTVHWVQRVDANFSARFTALDRGYRYVILEGPTAPAIGPHYVTWSPTRLDDRAMHLAAQHLLGERDFTSVRAAGCQSNTPFRCVYSASVARRGAFVVIDVRANAFLHHMVRNIAGALMRIGRREFSPDWMAALLAARDRSLAGPTAPPQGLYLVAVRYPPSYAFPVAPAPLILRALDEV
jgi:tRNA pseudouridine38-40 synthase